MLWCWWRWLARSRLAQRRELRPPWRFLARLPLARSQVGWQLPAPQVRPPSPTELRSWACPSRQSSRRSRLRAVHAPSPPPWQPRGARQVQPAAPMSSHASVRLAPPGPPRLASWRYWRRSPAASRCCQSPPGERTPRMRILQRPCDAARWSARCSLGRWRHHRASVRRRRPFRSSTSPRWRGWRQRSDLRWRRSGLGHLRLRHERLAAPVAPWLWRRQVQVRLRQRGSRFRLRQRLRPWVGRRQRAVA